MTEPTISEKQRLCLQAVEGLLVLNQYLNRLLDAYDFYVHRYPPTTESELAQFADLQVSISALGTLPHEMAAWISDVRNDRIRMVSADGFEQYVLNEFALHMHSLAVFMFRKKIEIEGFDAKLFGQIMDTLRVVNRKLT